MVLRVFILNQKRLVLQKVPLMGFVILSLSVVFAFLNIGCSARQAIPKTQQLKIPDAQTFAALHASLDILKDIPREPFRAFLPRARAAMLSSKDIKLRAIARALPDVPALYIGGLQKHFLPLLLARWARGRTRLRRAQAHRVLLQGDTQWRLGADAHAPRFMRQETYLRALSSEYGLKFNTLSELAYQITVRPAEGGIAPKMSISVALFARGDTAQPLALAAPKEVPGTLRENKLYGPAASSDRAAMIAAFFAIEAFLNSGVPAVRYPTLVIDRFGNFDGRGTRHFFETQGRPYRSLVLDGVLPFSTSNAGLLYVSTAAQDSEVFAEEDAARLVYAHAEVPKEQVPNLAQATFYVSDFKKVRDLLQKKALALWGKESLRNVLITQPTESLVSVIFRSQGGAIWNSTSKNNALQNLALLVREAIPQRSRCGKMLQNLARTGEIKAFSPLKAATLVPTRFELDERGRCELSLGAQLLAEKSVLQGAKEISRSQAEFAAKRRALTREAERAARQKPIQLGRKKGSQKKNIKKTKKRWKPKPIFEPIWIEPSAKWRKKLDQVLVEYWKGLLSQKMDVELIPPSMSARHSVLEESLLNAASLVYKNRLSPITGSPRASLARLLPNAQILGPLTSDKEMHLFELDDFIEIQELDSLVEFYTYILTEMCL